MSEAGEWQWEPVADPPPKPPRGKRPGRALKVIGGLLLVLALLVGGAALGQFLWPRQVAVTEVVVSAAEEAPEIEETRPMPNVLGMVESDARAAVADAGYADEITVTSTPRAGEPGTVVDQNPLPGAALGASAELIVSDPVEMPDVTGKDQAAAQTEIEALGGAAQIESVVDATAQPGTVLSTEPAAGAQMPQIVRVQVSTGGVARPLTELSTQSRSGCSTSSEVMINGRQFGSALTCSTSSRRDEPARAEYAISRKATYVRFTLGMPDAARDTTARAKVSVVGDGTVLFTEEIGFGSSSQHSVEIKDVIRLELLISGIGEDVTPEVAFGDISLIGLAADLDQLS